MSTFTFTAPVITPEQEEEERRALEADELTAIEAEVLGTEIPVWR